MRCRRPLARLALQVIHAPVFHGHAFSIAVELERPVEIPRSKRL
jgi:aspartate-semialdehyde dehydrogenase